MTTVDDSTRRALLAALADRRHYAWARANRPDGWSAARFAALVSNVMLRKSVSEEKENILRGVLGLEPVYRTSVVLRSTERVVAKPGYGRPRGYDEFKIRVGHAEADEIRRRLADGGWPSFSAWWHDIGRFAFADSMARD